MVSVEKIKEFVECLPKDDIKKAKELISKRKFRDLADLINSDIYLVYQNMHLQHPRKEFMDINLADLVILWDLVNSYRRGTEYNYEK